MARPEWEWAELPDELIIPEVIDPNPEKRDQSRTERKK